MTAGRHPAGLREFLCRRLVALPALLGFIIQWRDTAGKGKAPAKKRKPEEAVE